MNTILHEVYEWVYSIIIALAIAMVIHIFFFQPTRVSGESMVPTLHNGEYLIVSKLGHVMGYGHSSAFTYGPWAEQLMNNFYVNNLNKFPIDSSKYLNSSQNPTLYK